MYELARANKKCHKLPAEVVEEVTGLLETISKENPYKTLKIAIIKRIGKSNETLLQILTPMTKDTEVDMSELTPPNFLIFQTVTRGRSPVLYVLGDIFFSPSFSLLFS